MKTLKINVSGNSHDQYIYLTASNIPNGLVIDHDLIKTNLSKRKPHNFFNTNRIEEDIYDFLSGVENNITTGEELIIRVSNNNVSSKDYQYGIIRPGHADYVGYETIKEYDYRGGGPFSGRLTVLFVILGSILQPYVFERVYGKISQIGNITDTKIIDLTTQQLQEINNELYFYNPEKFDKALNLLKKAKINNDSVGGLVEIKITNPSLGLGGLYFDSFESNLCQNLFAIGGIKGINFGLGFDFVTKSGNYCADSLSIHENKISSLHNCQGGINGGITNGYEDIIFNCIIKPPASTFTSRKTIIKTDTAYQNYTLNLTGRHDVFIANRILPVIIAMTYITIFDEYITKGLDLNI